MKKNYIIYLYLAFSFLLLMGSCNEEANLPYPYKDEIGRGALIDIERIPGTSTFVETDPSAVNLGFNLQMVEKGAGQFSKLQLVCVYNNEEVVVVEDNITKVPHESRPDFIKVLSQLGIAAPAPGDNFSFAVNVVRNDGVIIPGWIKESKTYNNQAFANWNFNGRLYSYKVSFGTQCTFNYDDFSGNYLLTTDASESDLPVTVSHISELPDASLIPDGVVTTDLYGIEISGLMTPLKVWINVKDYTLIIPTPVIILPSYGPYSNFRIKTIVETEAGSCDASLAFSALCGVDQGNFGSPFIFIFNKK